MNYYQHYYWSSTVQKHSQFARAMIIATVASALLLLCAICNSVPIITLSELFRDSHIYTEDIKAKLYQYKHQGMLNATLQSLLRPVTFNAFKMLTDLGNHILSVEDSRHRTMALEDVVVDFLPRAGRRYAPLMSSGGTIDARSFTSSFPEYAEVVNIVGGIHNTVTANEFVTIDIADIMFKNSLESRTVMDAADWQQFVTNVPTLTSGWSFEDLADAFRQINYKEFAAFIFFVCMSGGPKTVTMGKWIQMGGLPHRFTGLTGGEDVLSWQTWKEHVCGH